MKNEPNYLKDRNYEKNALNFSKIKKNKEIKKKGRKYRK
jgi:hypothetical protein